jgi:hypothetical protein
LFSALFQQALKLMFSTAPLRSFIRKAREQIEPDLSDPGAKEEAFNHLFGWLAGKIAETLGAACVPDLFPTCSTQAALKAVADPLDSVDLQPFWQAEETLGWAYQFWNEKDRLEIFKRLYKQKQKISPEEISAATQLFTPRWIVRVLVENTLGRLWIAMHPDSALTEKLAYLIPVSSPMTAEPLRLVREITLFDPACGTMHFGLAAFDLFAGMYREELSRAGQPGWPQAASVEREAEIPASILKNNVYGADIDPHAIRLASTALLIKAGCLHLDGAVPNPNLSCIPAPAGSLLRSPIDRSFDCVVTNPPYMVSRNMPPGLSAFLREFYPDAKGDLYSAFILRCLEFTRPGGRSGLITQQSFMFLPSYRKLRASVLRETVLETLLHTGPRAFDEINGEKVNTVVFTLRRDSGPARTQAPAIYVRLSQKPGAEIKHRAFEQALHFLRQGQLPDFVYCVRQEIFSAIPGQPWVFWTPQEILSVFQRCPNLKHLDGTDGNKTGANRRFLRHRRDLTEEEINNGCWRWLTRPDIQLPYRQVFEHMVDWSAEAQAFYQHNPSSSKISERLVGRSGICWSRVASHRFAARRFPGGYIPDVATPAIYPEEDESASLLAILNSTPGRYLLKIINPTINYALGDVRRLPVPTHTDGDRQILGPLVAQIEGLYTHLDWKLHPLSETQRQIEALEAEIDRIVYGLYGFSEEEIRVIENEMQLHLTQ